MRPLRVLCFGAYSKGPGYPRTTTLVEGLRALGHEVVEVHAPLFSGAAERVAAGRGRVLPLALRQGRSMVALAAGWFRAGSHDLALVGAGGLVDAPLLRLLQNVDRVPLVWDDFVPLYDAAVRDRGLAPESSARARALLRAERLSARVADLVLADTEEHADLLAGELRVPRAKLAVVEVAQPDPGDPHPLPADGPLRVLLVATYVPLHGVATVVEAARQLAGEGVEITIVGRGQEHDRVEASARGVPGLTLVPQLLPEEEVLVRLRGSHVGLGVFGDTPKAARVVPLKAALVLAAGRALVTRAGPAADRALADAALLVAPADPGALAESLRRLRDDRAELVRLAAAGRARYVARFTPEAAARALLAALEGRGLLGG